MDEREIRREGGREEVEKCNVGSTGRKENGCQASCGDRKTTSFAPQILKNH